MADVLGTIIPIVIVLAVLYRFVGGAIRRSGDQRDRQARGEQGMPHQTRAAPEGLREQLRRRAEALRQERLGGLRGRSGGLGAGARGRAREPLESPWIEEEEVRSVAPPELPGVGALLGQPEARGEPEQTLSAAIPTSPAMHREPARARPRARRRPVLAEFASRGGLRLAMVAREVLGPPKSLQSPGE